MTSPGEIERPRVGGHWAGKEWSDAHIKAVRKLWAEGKSATEIGHAIGKSRSAILGKVKRLGLSGRRVTVRRPPARRKDRLSPKLSPRSNVPVRAKRAKPIPPAPNNPEPPHDPKYIPKSKAWEALPGSKPIAELIETTGCEWPIGAYPFHWCNEPKVEGRPYCAAHCKAGTQQREKSLKGAGTFKSLGEALQGAFE